MKKKKKDEVEWFASWILETTAEHWKKPQL